MSDDNNTPKPGQHVSLHETRKAANKKRGKTGGKVTQAAPKVEPTVEPEPVIEPTPATVINNYTTVTPDNAEFSAIAAEIVKQDEKWGQQDHPMNGGKIPERGRISHDGQADVWKAINDARKTAGQLGWDGILLEESYEAAGARTVEEQIEELVQVAAVAVQAIRALKRQAAA